MKENLATAVITHEHLGSIAHNERGLVRFPLFEQNVQEGYAFSVKCPISLTRKLL